MIYSSRPLLRVLLLIAGAAIGVESLLAFRLGDWPIYVAFLLVYFCVFFPAVEVLPGLRLPIPNMAVTIGFLYIGGLPIVVLRGISPLLSWFVVRGLPDPWRRQIGRAWNAGASLFWDAWAYDAASNMSVAAEWAMFSLGMATRWRIARTIAPDGLPAQSPWAMALAEVGGYACWGLLALLPVYPDRPLLPLSVDKEPGTVRLSRGLAPSAGGFRSALADMELIVGLALTPFVFLIAYGYRADGLFGAVAWSLSTLGLHFMLKRMNERRMTLEEQNRRLEALNRELEHRERLAAIGKMSSVVSHQILHQLGVIGVYADLIRNADGTSDPETAIDQTRDHARAIEGALGEVNRVVNDLLVFSRDLRLNLYTHSVRSLLEECLAECRADAERYGVELHLTCAGDLETTFDKLKLKQAILNVLRNAIEVSLHGSAVDILASVNDSVVRIAVSDQGPGVPEATREAIFAPFFTTKEHGTGLGLAIAREFVEAHGGRIWAEKREKPPGSTFVFCLPLEVASGEAGRGENRL